MTRCLAVLALLWLVGGPLRAQDEVPEPPTPPAEETPAEPTQEPPPPPSTPEELEHLARQYLGGNSKARDRLRTAGVRAVPVLRALIDDESRTELEAFVALIAVDALEESLAREPGLVYRGQFQTCEVLGTEGVAAFLAVFRDEDQTQVARTRAAIALGDIAPGAGASDVLAPALLEIIEDFLSEPWFEQEAGYLLVRLGDRSYVDPLIARWEEVARQPPTRTRLAELLDAHTKLAEVHYRVGAYPEAIGHYLKKAAILEDVLERVRDEVRAGLEAELALLYYNLACSQSLAGRVDAARTSLERALTHDEVDLDMVAADGDLRGLRAMPGHEAWVETMRARLQAGPPLEEPEPSGK